MAEEDIIMKSPVFKEYTCRARKELLAEPPNPNWNRQWHGYCFPPDYQYWSSGWFERFAFLSIVELYAGKTINFFELGAGRADWCMILAGAVNYGLVENPPKSYRVLAIEAEPKHFEWTRRCIEEQGINGIPVWGAISDKVGKCQFLADTDPLVHFGQRIAHVNESGVEVSMYTVDSLREEYLFDQIQMIHMDVQGSEADAIHGCSESLKQGKIDHIIIATHNAKVEDEIKQALASTHDLIADLPKGGRLSFPNFSRLVIGKGDGVQVWQRKGVV
jgi:FkbM family methyltransferase